MKKIILSIATISFLTVSNLSADKLTKSESEFLGLTTNNSISITKKEMIGTKGKQAYGSFTCSPYVGGAYVLGYNKKSGLWFQKQGNTYYITGGF